jgi:hypothetical protein
VYARVDEKGRLAERPRLPDAVAEARVDPAPRRPTPVQALPRPMNGRTVAA